MTRGTTESPGGAGLRRAVLLGLFAGTGVGVGYLLAGIPNVELVTLVAALAGAVLGRGGGFAAGALAAAAFSLGNPIGKPPPQLLLAQVAGMGIAGALGAVAAGPVVALRAGGRRALAAGLAGGTGLVATLFYDVATNVAGAAAFAVDWRVALAGAIPFTLVHAGVNVVLFALFFPPLSGRYRHRARSPLRGRGGASALAVAGALALAAGHAAAQAPAPASGATARPDTATAAAADTAGALAPAGPWSPFAANLVEWMARDSRWLPVADGGFGARLVVRHEADTAPWPLVLRDGVPLGTGHRWADEPWLAAVTGQEPAVAGYGADGWGGTAGAVRLAAADTYPALPVAALRFYKGNHETYLRSAAFRTPRAPWRLRFDFEETLDREGYALRRDDDPRFGFARVGSAALRAGRGTLERRWEDGALALSLETVRKHRQALPAADVDHEEIWADRASLAWRGRAADVRLRAVLFLAGADVQRARSRAGADSLRKIETAREGALVEVASADGRRLLCGAVAAWTLHDDGVKEEEAPGWGGSRRATGEEGWLRASWHAGRGGYDLAPALAAWWDGAGGWRPGGELVARATGPSPAWELRLEAGGRAPRPDELATPDAVAAPPLSGEPGRVWRLLPNPDLRRERLWRLAGRIARTLGGTEVALDGSFRSLRDGIGWEPEGGPDATTGRWANTLRLDAWVVTASAAAQARGFGLLRARAAVTRRGHDLRGGVPLGLPPERSASLGVDWEYTAFHGDGVFEIGYRLASTGAYDDPWLPGLLPEVPGRTVHDLLLGFRLLGADLSLGLLNLADDRAPVSAGALADGRQLRWRLEWTLLR